MNRLPDNLKDLPPEMLEALVRKLNKGKPAGKRSIPRQPREDGVGLPLSFAQRRLWFIDRYLRDSPSYNIVSAVWLTGRLDAAAMEAALNEIVRRHEVLRTVYQAEEARQVPRPHQPFALPAEELGGEPDPQAAAMARLAEEARQPFDLQRGPVFRPRLLALGEDRHLLVVAIHHIASDGWSQRVLIEEIGALYAAYRQGQGSPLPEPAIQYADYAAWQRQTLQGESLARQIDYWRGRLADPPDLGLTLDAPRPRQQTFDGANQAIDFPDGLAGLLRALCAAEDATPFMALLAGFAALLHRYTGDGDLIIGAPFANRGHAETRKLIGFFINTLPLRLRFTGETSFRDLLREARQAVREAQDCQELPFEKLVDELDIERDPSRTPLYQVVLNYQKQAGSGAADAGAGLELTFLNPDTGTAKFDITLDIFESERGFEGFFNYNTRLFQPETMAAFSRGFARLTTAAAADPDRPLGAYPLLDEAERRALTGRLADLPEPAFDPRRPLHALFEAQAARSPSATAVVFEDRELSYAELDRAANRLARGLRRRGVGPDTLVGLCLERSERLPAAILGVLKAGGAYAPMDPAYPRERLKLIAEDSGAVLTVVDAVSRDKLAGLATVALDALAAEDGPARQPGAALDPACAAYVIYTSGSTGRPKGVVVPHGAVTRLFAYTQRWFDFGPDDVWTLFHSYAFDFSVWELWGALLFGGRVVVVPYWTSRSPQDFYQLLRESRVTVLSQSPSAFRQLTHLEQSGEQEPPQHLRVVVFGAEALELKSLDPWFQRHGDRRPRLVNMFGITETTVHVTYRPVGVDDLDFGPGSPIGEPLPDLRTYVLDGCMNPVPAGAPGEIFVGGAGLARGYLNQPALTAERFTPHPFTDPDQPGARLYRSGDRGRLLADGELVHLGRVDRQVKVRGFRIEPGEIQAAIEDHDAVSRAVVLAETDPAGRAQLLAYVKPLARGAADAGDLRAYLAERLPDHMVPARFAIVDEFPLTAHGKLDRRALPKPEEMRVEAVAAYAPPQTEMEEILAECWQLALGLERVGRDDNFFALGGDSIVSVRVAAEAKKRGLAFSLQQLFQNQTVRALAAAAGTDSAEPEPAAADRSFALIDESTRARLPEGVEDAYPMAQLQLGMLYHLEMAGDAMPYHNVNSSRYQGAAERRLFEEAARRLTARHPILRTGLSLSAYGEPLQLVHRQARPAVFWADLRELDGEAQDRAVRDYFARERGTPFDLEKPPLIRFGVHELADDRFQFTVTDCHAILDGWSVDLIMRDLFKIYVALLKGDEAAIEPPPRQTYRAFIALEQEAVRSGASRDFWRDRLAGFQRLELPRWPTPPDQGPPALAAAPLTLGADQVAELQRFANRAEVPFKSVLLAAHVKVMSELSGLDDVLTGVQVNGRPETEDGDKVPGLFLNAAPFRLRLAGRSWLDLARAAFLAEQEALPHRRYPYALIQKAHGDEPLFETLFNYVHYHSRDTVSRTLRVESAGGEMIQEPNHFPFTANFNLHPATSELNVSLAAVNSFSREQLGAMAGLYRQTLANMAASARADAAPADHWAQGSLPVAERRLLLETWNDTAADYARDQCLHQLFEARAAAAPEALAYRGDADFSYGEVNRRANRLARVLAARGVGPESLVGVCMARAPEMAVALLAALKTGAAFTPLDPAYPEARLRFAIEDAGLRLILVRGDAPENRRLPAPSGVALLDVDAIDAAGDDADLARPADPRQPAFLIYTSGSTGQPKGVLGTHRGMVNRFQWMWRAFPFAEGEICAQKTSLNFVDSLWEILGPTLAGTPVAFFDEATLKDPRRFVPALAEAGVTRLLLVPSLLRAMLDAWPDLAARLPKLALWTVSGEALPAELCRRFRQAAPQAVLLNLYGASEVSADVSWQVIEADPTTSVAPIGKPIANTRLYVLGAGARPAPIGAPGELFVAGDSLARGYLGAPDRTAERFTPDPFAAEPGARMYRTGDLTRWLPGGALDYLGRVDHQVKIRGMRVELGEVEAALAAAPQVAQAVVAATADRRGEPTLAAYLVPEAGAAVEPAAVRAALKRALPEHMIPDGYVVLDALPLTPNGKVDRGALPEPGAAAIAPSAAEYVAPRNEVEEELAAIWAEVLDRPRIGVADHFFETGGHSLRALQALSRVRDAFGLELSLPDFFAAPTIARLAERVARETRRDDGDAAPIPVIDRGQDLPLSFAQQRLWFLDRWEGPSATYNMPSAMRFRGVLDAAALERAVAAIIRRHESLRTRFVESDGRAVQAIDPPGRFRVPFLDLRGLTDPDRQRAAAALKFDDAQTPFDLARGPLMRLNLAWLADGDCLLLLTTHHIISDFWSIGVFIRELAALYRRALDRAGDADLDRALAPLPIQYADYAHWQRRQLSGELLERQLAYWRERLAGAPTLHELVTDCPRPPALTFNGDNRDFVIGAETADRLETLGRRRGATLFMTLQAMFAVMLSRYSGSRDISIGSPVANRNRREVEPLIGFFINTLVFRHDLGGAPTFAEFLDRVRAAALEAYACQDIPFEQVVDALQPERNYSHSPLFQIMFVLQNAPMGALELPGLALSFPKTETVTAKFDLNLLFIQNEDGLHGAIEFNIDLFRADTIERMIGHFKTLTAAVAAAPDTPVAALPLLDEAERRLATHAWNDTDAPFDEDALMHGLFEAQAARTPDAPALVYGETVLDYDALNRRANRLAHELRARGVGPGALVGVCLPREPDMVTAVLAIVKAGGAYAPIEPGFPKARIAFILDSVGGRCLTNRATRDRLDGVVADWTLVDETDLSGRSDADPPPNVGAGDLAYIIFTSGSTGRPKGVIEQHRPAVNLIQWVNQTFDVGPGDRLLLVASLCFDLSVYDIFGSLACGAAICLAGDDEVGDPEALVRLLDRYEVTFWDSAPAALQQITPFLPPQNAESLRLVFLSGDWVPLSLPPVLADFFPNLKLIALGGATEATIWSNSFPVTRIEPHWRSVPYGKPIQNARYFALEPNLEPAPIGVPGDLYIGGRCLSFGYYGQPALTAERYVPDPFAAEPGRALYRTGDRARWMADGNMEFLGRLDHQVKVRGFRIELGELETALRDHEAVAEAVALVRGARDGDKRLLAYVRLESAVHGQAAALARELREWLRDKLPDYMTPAAVTPVDQWPLTANGKLDRDALPEPDEAGPAAPAAPPRNAIEQGLAEIWAAMLKRDQVGVDDNFFDLGGHSLLATQAVARIRARFGAELSLQEMFTKPTVAELAPRVAALRGQATAEPIERLDADGAFPLSYAQERMWFLARMDPGGAAYNIPAALRFTGELDESALRRALTTILERQTALRVVFPLVDGAPTTRLLPAELEMEVEDLRAVPADRREAEAVRLAERHARRGFNIETGPLFRTALLRLGDRECLFLINMHHIAADGWSLGVLIRELAALYAAYRDGRESPLAEPPIRYEHYALWQRRRFERGAFAEMLAYWRGQLADEPEPLALPLDRPRPKVFQYRGAVHRFALPAELTAAVGRLVRREKLTHFMALLAGFQILLAKYSGQRDIAVGAPVANRDRPETEELIGFFVNTLIVRARVDDAATVGETLAQVRDRALAAFDAQALPFEKLVEEINPQRDLSRNPLFQTMFILQNAPMPALRLPDLDLALLEVDDQSAKVDLALNLVESPDDIRGAFQYNADLFEPETVARLARHYQAALAAMTERLDCPVGELSILDEAERVRILETWNDTAEPMPAVTVHGLFEARARQSPDAPALFFGDASWTYGQLNARANQLARGLRRRGLKPEQVVAVCMARALEIPLAMLAIFKAGGAYLPLDPDLPADRLAFMLDDSDAGFVLTRAADADRAPGGKAELIRLDDDWPDLAGGDDGDLSPIEPLDRLAYVIYTSGSTGWPKGVMVAHRGLPIFARTLGRRFGLKPGDRMLQFFSNSFDASMGEMLPPLVTGAALVNAPRHELLPGPALADVLRLRGITHMTLTPSSLRLLPVARYPALRLLFIGGEAVPADLVEAWRGHCQFFNVYGPTEATICAAMTECRGDEPKPPIGPPIVNMRAYPLDRRLGPVPPGAPGMLYLAGPGLARGYLGQPARTAETFLPNPFAEEPGARMYRTGDLARWRADGQLDYVGRADGQVKIRGYRIELGEIETALHRDPRVRRAAVVALADDEGLKRLVAYLETVEPATPELLTELKDGLKTSLPDYMTPAAMVPMAKMPVTASGKIDRKKLPRPEAFDAVGARAYTPPAQGVEQAVAEIWQEALSVKRVGVNDNFFELGGNSLLIVRLQDRLQKRFGVELTMPEMFEHITVKRMARRLQEQAQSTAVQDAQARGQTRKDLMKQRRARRRRN